MTLPASGSISLGQVNTELGVSATATRSLGDSTTRTLFGVPSGAISLSQGYGKANQFAFTISANQTNADLRTLAVNAGWNQLTKVVATIGSGVYVSSNSTGTPALTVSGSFPGGVSLANNGFIVGMGGPGGFGGTTSGVNGTNGGGGGLALSASSAVSITNNGTIAGGGGGGGGSLAYRYDYDIGKTIATAFVEGVGGGGGRSSNFNSAGGYPSGGAGTISAAGAGGGSGGGWGAAGSSGSTAMSGQNPQALSGAGAGGSGGGAVTGNANITWVATGTRLGAIT